MDHHGKQKKITDTYSDETKIRTRQTQRVATDTWRSLGCRATPLEHWSERKPTVEPRWAKQQTQELRAQPPKLNSFMSRSTFNLMHDPPACYKRGKQIYQP